MTLRSPKHFKGIFTPYPGDAPLITRSRKWLQSYISNYIPSMISPEGSFLFNGFKSFPGGSVGKRVLLQCRRPGFDSLVGKIPWRKAWQPTPVFLPGESHGQRSLVGYSPWGLARVRQTERLNHCCHQSCLYKSFSLIFLTLIWLVSTGHVIMGFWFIFFINL